MAVLYHARRNADGVDVALKVLRPEFAATILRERFHQEIAILSELHHPNILPLLESNQAEHLLYYVMPFAHGASLKERIETDRHLPVDEALAIVRDVAAALDYAHERDVVHRDVKPANMMFTEEGRAVICDFGVARAVARAGGERLSTSGLVVGTPAYMSPEQASGGKVDYRSDIYSLGCVAYAMLAGEPPFGGRTAQIIMARHVREHPPKLRIVRHEVPEAVEAAVLAALEKDPVKRPPSAGAFAARMEA
jgi:serine/threonine protein kinase